MKINKMFLIFVVLLLFVSCQSKKRSNEEIFYPEINEIDYESMEKVSTYLIENNLKYYYTFFIEDDACMNAFVSVNFETVEETEKFYNNLFEEDLYLNLKKNNKTVTYYHNPENFIYMMYPKNSLIDMLEENGFVLINN